MKEQMMNTNLSGTEIAAAFMQQNDKRTWKARAVNRPRASGHTDVVHFDSQGGMVALMYYTETGLFAVKFNKFQGAWGDYIKAIARSLFVVLNTLKSAGLPFDAPASLAGMVIEATTTDDTTTYVRWPSTPVVDASPYPRTGEPGLVEGLEALGTDATAHLLASPANAERLRGAIADLDGLPPLPPVL
jgi:hypothetical protein